MKKRILCALLCLGLCLSSVQAAEGGFADVGDTDWFSPYVSVCVEHGLMNGTGGGNFSPEGTLTMAEAAAIAARLGEALNNRAVVRGTPNPGETLPWYYWEVEYLKDYGVTVDQPQRSATRQDFFALLSAVTPASSLAAINSIEALPDTQDPGVLAFYNAGVLTGTDAYGTFSPQGTLTRSEVAAMVARILEPGLRQDFVPQEPPPADDLSGKIAMTVNGTPVTAQELARWGVQVAYYLDSYYYNNFGVRLTWDQEMEQLILAQAQQQCVAYVVMEAKARELGCDVTGLAAALSPDPSQEELSAYVQSADLLCAKHILVADESTAQSIITALQAQPTMDQFNAILSVLGTDPGMTSNPDGYLFTAGEMVAEFETGVRSLPIGGFSADPVQSSFGFHVILRLDPLTHPDLLPQYREAVMNDLVDQWMAAATVQVVQPVIDQLDLPATYTSYLESLSSSQ